MKAPLGHILTLLISVMAVWLLLSGHYTPFLIILGLISTAIVVFFAERMDFVDEEGVPIVHMTSKILTYIPWFLLEIVRSNMAAVRVILNPSLPINPRMFRVKGMQRTDLGKMIFANSITLTPGTITVAIRGDVFHVHALVADDAEGMDEGEMNVRVAALEKGMLD